MLTSHVKVFLSDRYILYSFAASFAIHLVIWYIVLFRSSFASDLLILHYNIEFGVDLVGTRYAVFAIPIVGFVFIIFDLVFSFYLYDRLRVYSYILLIACIALQIILAVAALLIVFLNT